MIRSSNPVLKDSKFDAHAYLTGQPAVARMTLSGTLNKCLLLFAILLATSVGSAVLVLGNPGLLFPLVLGGALGGFALALLISIKQELAPVLAPVYAAVEGLAVGAISLLFESRYPGVVLNAVLGTFGTMGAVLLLYRAGILRATPMFVKTIVFATFGICGIYILNLVLRLFGLQFDPIYQSGPIGIGFSVIVCIVAALNFVLDFDTIDRGVKNGAPKQMEWYGAFGVTVTLVWLYIEMLRLLSKLRR
ncbi:Bax inhibitor-1/YccA family protein [soil metagenome]